PLSHPTRRSSDLRVERGIGRASVCHGVADLPFLDRPPRVLPCGAVSRCARGGEDPTVVDGRCHTGRRRAEGEEPLDLVATGSAHADASLRLRLMMRGAQWVQVRGLGPPTACGLRVVEGDAVVDLALMGW